MSTGQTEPLILAIGSRDDFLHVYQNDKELLADNSIGAEPGEFSGALEFFDSDGHRLAGVYNRQWKLQQLTQATSKPTLTALLRRVQNTINHLVRSFVKENPEESAEFSAAVKEILEQLPRLKTSADLRKFLETFFARPIVEDEAPIFGFDGVQGDPQHNFWKRLDFH